MFKLLQKVLNLSETKSPPESDIIFFGSLYSGKLILMLILGYLLIDLVFLMIRNLL